LRDRGRIPRDLDVRPKEEGELLERVRDDHLSYSLYICQCWLCVGLRKLCKARM
jgi:hypothetical protein